MKSEQGKYGDGTFMERGEGRTLTNEERPCLSYLRVSAAPMIPAEDDAGGDGNGLELSATASNAAAL
jgi:hypothetical protein